ncbi:IS4 family transposase [Sporosarcina sp. 179-K 3D1 HS]|uniref:IS4 family transposase n=1 Tax=Sporosarcina sp. 179-K 3D1 HS TaxID=3232169 RepID=UPI0039A0BF8C
MGSIDQNLVFRQILSLLPATRLACPLMNYDEKKLPDSALVKAFILGILFQWGSHRDISENIRARKSIQRELGLASISHSQLSRRLFDLDTNLLVDLLGQLAQAFWILQRHAVGINSLVGILRIIDGTYVKLPDSASCWTAISKVSSGIKLHLRIVVASADSVFPEKMVASTGNVADSDAVNHLIDEDALYVMDRGYAHKTKMGGWLARNSQFLVRIRKTFRFETLRAYSPTHPAVCRNELVSIQTRPEILRYIEFKDEEGTTFRLLTNRLDLSEEDILETYKNRWYIELFFKWIKQHLKVDHIYSQSPKGIWNQMYLTLITFALIELMRLIHQPKKSAWDFLRQVRVYSFLPISRLLANCNRRLRKSKGRQKVPERIPIEIKYGEDVAIVDPIAKEHFLKKG